jgi:hypothetical protein
MPTRAPKKTTAAAIKRQAAAPAVLTCPECGKTFTRAAAMGAHRSRIHGVAGSSRSTRRNRTTVTTAEPATRATRTLTRRRAVTAGGNGRSTGNGGVDRDRLLKTLFPHGIPARQDTIAEVNDWLNEADRLSRL